MKKSPNPIGNWREKIEKWEWLFNRRPLIKNFLTQQGIEEKNQRLVRLKNKNRDSSVPRLDLSDSGALRTLPAMHEREVDKSIKNLLTQKETVEENRRFFMKTEQTSDLIWSDRSYVRERAKGSILFSWFVGAIGWLFSLPLSNRLGCWLDYKPSHWRSGIDERISHCRLLRVILVD